MLNISKFHADTVHFLDQVLGKSEVIKRSTYSTKRDILIHYIKFATNSQDGLDRNINGFKRGKWVVNDGVELYQVEVFGHKTLLSSCSAHINMTRNVYNWITSFITHIRQCCCHLFVQLKKSHTYRYPVTLGQGNFR